MKRIIGIAIICSLVLSLVGCGSNKNLTIDGKTYEFVQYGLVNDDEKNDKVKYQIITSNIIWSCILVETIFVPVILIGWFLYEPIDVKYEDKMIGTK